MKVARLRWRCRRGIRELDLLLLAYLESSYRLASPEEQVLFEAWLKAPDPWLWSKLHQPPADDPLEQQLIQAILKTRGPVLS